jgi:hypothetical protein
LRTTAIPEKSDDEPIVLALQLREALRTTILQGERFIGALPDKVVSIKKRRQ